MLPFFRFKVDWIYGLILEDSSFVYTEPLLYSIFKGVLARCYYSPLETLEMLFLEPMTVMTLDDFFRSRFNCEVITVSGFLANNLGLFCDRFLCDCYLLVSHSWFFKVTVNSFEALPPKVYYSRFKG